MQITTWEAHKKYGLSTGYLRRLLAKGVLKGREAPITSRRKVWFLDENSLKKYLKTDRKPGPKSKK
jgi:hypothetical protein